MNQWRKPKREPKFPKAPAGVKKRPIDQSYSEIEKKLDTVYSQLVRLDAAGGNGFCTCVTCGAIHYWNDLDNGHYISRALRWTRWHQMNCRPQCKKCNRYLDGAKHEFRRRLVDDYGEEAVAKLEREASQWGEKRIPKEQMLGILADCRAQVRQIRKDKGL